MNIEEQIPKIVDELNELALYYEVDLYYFWEVEGDCGGQMDPYRQIIGINMIHAYESRSAMLQIFFHELGHILCVRNKKFDNYHYPFDKEMTKAQFLKYKRTWMRAERYVDNMAEELLSYYDKRCKYEKSYDDPRVVKEMKRIIKEFTFSDYKRMINYVKNTPIFT